jgi:signal transduction histidine kinase
VTLSPPGQFFTLGAALTLALVITGLCAVRYRGTRNPAALFLTTGFAVLAANVLLVVVWRRLHPGMGSQQAAQVSATAVPTFRAGRQVLGWWFIGWVGAGAGLLLARPWWDRRGRKPLDPRIVAGLAAASTFLLDMIVALVTRAAPAATALRTPGPGTAAWILGVVVVGLLIAAGVRSLRRPWASLFVCLAAFVGAGAAAAQLQHVTLASDAFRRIDFASVVALALVFGALLLDERTDRTRMRRATDRARAVMGGRAEIASMLGHEVKGPVATIRGLAATTINHYERLSDAERREFLSLIEQESRKLLVTVDQASLGMKVDARTLSFVTNPTNLALVVRDVLDSFDAGEHQLTFTAPDPAVTTTVDRKWLAEALRQLVVNAATFSPPRSPIKIVVRRANQATGTIDVIDEGPGVPLDKRETVFEKFAAYRPPGYEEAAGTGLGLFIARGIARAHGGDVRFADRPREGTMLSIELPIEGPTGGTA